MTEKSLFPRLIRYFANLFQTLFNTVFNTNMNFKSFFRLIHSTPLIYSAEKSSLAVLRKKTGYTFANCKKALELHQNDLTKVKKWICSRYEASINKITISGWTMVKRTSAGSWLVKDNKAGRTRNETRADWCGCTEKHWRNGWSKLWNGLCCSKQDLPTVRWICFCCMCSAMHSASDQQWWTVEGKF